MHPDLKFNYVSIPHPLCMSSMEFIELYPTRFSLINNVNNMMGILF